MKITELIGKALQTALKEEREGEWDGKKVDNETLIQFSLMNKTEYDEDGKFLRYGKE